MIICLMGKSGTYKTTTCDVLEAQGIPRIRTYTNRPMRAGEVQGDTYNFLNRSFADEKQANDFALKEGFAEFKIYNAYCKESGKYETWLYGSKLPDCTDTLCTIILTPAGFKDILIAMDEGRISRQELLPVLVEVDEAVRRDKLIARGDAPKEIERRLKTDNDDFAEIEKDDSVLHIDFTGRTKEECADLVLKNFFKQSRTL